MSLITKMDNRIKIRNCRICLNASSVNMVLLEDEWLRLFELCFGFALTTEDEPRLLCKACAEKVQSYVEFKEICQKSHCVWNSVKSTGNCDIEHLNVDNTMQDVNDPISINNESCDASSGNDEDETVDLSPADVKIEIDEEDMKLNNGSLQELYKKDDLVIKQVNSKQKARGKSCKRLVNSDASVNCKKVYNCEYCKIKIHATKRIYLEHLKKCQVKVPTKRKRLIINQDDYDCGLCEVSFSTPDALCSHLNDHWFNNNLACKLCDFVGADLAATAAHRYSHSVRQDTSQYMCHICKISKRSLLALQFHYRKDHLKKNGGHCSMCNKEYTSLRYWRKHEATTHSTPRYTCDICGKEYYFKHVIREHMMNHMQLNNCICDICGNIFTRQRYLKLHKETVHCVSGPFKCTHCNKFFKNQNSLSMHMKLLAREKKEKCDICHKSFITPNVLKLHKVMHSDERPHRCIICNCSYKHKSHLKAHLLMHTRVSTYKCLMCSKTFTTARSLKRHSSVHMEVRK